MSRKKINLIAFVITFAVVFVIIKRKSHPSDSVKSEVETAVPTTKILADQQPESTKPTAIIPTKIHEEFSALVKETQGSIPSLEQLRSLPASEVHFTPKPLIEASIKLGDIAQALADHPELVAEGMLFYYDCAEDSTYPNSIRASCFSEWKKWSAKSGAKDPSPKVSAQIEHLADGLN